MNTRNHIALYFLQDAPHLVPETGICPKPIKSLPIFDPWEIPRGNVILEGDNLGDGCFSKVYKGIVKGPISSSKVMKRSICKTVAIKLLKSELSKVGVVAKFYPCITFVWPERFFHGLLQIQF